MTPTEWGFRKCLPQGEVELEHVNALIDQDARAGEKLVAGAGESEKAR